MNDINMNDQVVPADLHGPQEDSGPRTAKRMDIWGIVNLTAKMPDGKQIIALKRRLAQVVEEMESNEVTLERTRETIEELRKIDTIEDTVNALDAFLSGKPKFVAQLARQIAQYWDENSQTQSQEVKPQQAISTSGQIKQNRTDDESYAWDIINSQD